MDKPVTCNPSKQVVYRLRAYMFRIYPSTAQEQEMKHHLWLSKELWNEMLTAVKKRYDIEKKFPSRQELLEIVKKRGLYSQTAQELVDRLQNALRQKVRGKKKGKRCGFPRFKSFLELGINRVSKVASVTLI